MRAFPQAAGPLLVHLHNVSGGVLAGDRLGLDIDVAANAEAQITTTGATRLYRHRRGALDSEQITRVSVGRGALFEYLPDPVIPYRGARHLQSTRIDLDAGATLFWWEALAPGRQAAGEEFAFESLRIRNRVMIGARPVLAEDFRLEPRKRPLFSSARMERYRWTASLIVCREGQKPEVWRTLEDELNALAQEHSREGEAIWGASALAADGVAVRGLSRSGRGIHPALIDFWRLAKRRIAGAEALPPRKVN